MATVNWEDPTWKKWLTFAEEHDCVVGATRDRFSPSEGTWLEHFNPKVKDLPMPQIPYGKGPMSGMSGPQNRIHCVKQQLVFFVGETCFEANIAWMMHRFYTTLGGIYIYISTMDESPPWEWLMELRWPGPPGGKGKVGKLGRLKKVVGNG